MQEVNTSKRYLLHHARSHLNFIFSGALDFLVISKWLQPHFSIQSRIVITRHQQRVQYNRGLTSSLSTPLPSMESSSNMSVSLPPDWTSYPGLCSHSTWQKQPGIIKFSSGRVTSSTPAVSDESTTAGTLAQHRHLAPRQNEGAVHKSVHLTNLYKMVQQHETLCLPWEYIAAEDSSVMESHDLQSQASAFLIALFSRGKSIPGMVYNAFVTQNYCLLNRRYRESSGLNFQWLLRTSSLSRQLLFPVRGSSPSVEMQHLS